jgi:hypothetical protein
MFADRLYIDRVLPVLSQNEFDFRQVPQMAIVGSSFPLASPTQVLVDGGAAIVPKAPTHVVISASDVLTSPGGTKLPTPPLGIGTLVRLVEVKDGWALVARDGDKLGYVSETALVAAQ